MVALFQASSCTASKFFYILHQPIILIFWSFDYGSWSRHLLLLLVLNANSFEEIALAEISHHLSFGLIATFVVISLLKAIQHYNLWGVYEEELKLSFPCDRFIEQQHAVYYRGITINTAPEVIFRWLCQLRIAPYSYDWVDNFGIKSPDTLT